MSLIFLSERNCLLSGLFALVLRAAMKKRSTQIPCETCDGRGTVDLGGVLAETFAFFVTRRTRLTAQHIAEATPGGVKATAVSNRLEKLRRVGLLNRKKEGRAQVYFRSSMPG